MGEAPSGRAGVIEFARNQTRRCCVRPAGYALPCRSLPISDYWEGNVPSRQDSSASRLNEATNIDNRVTIDFSVRKLFRRQRSGRARCRNCARLVPAYGYSWSLRLNMRVCYNAS